MSRPDGMRSPSVTMRDACHPEHAAVSVFVSGQNIWASGNPGAFTPSIRASASSTPSGAIGIGIPRSSLGWSCLSAHSSTTASVSAATFATAAWLAIAVLMRRAISRVFSSSAVPNVMPGSTPACISAVATSGRRAAGSSLLFGTRIRLWISGKATRASSLGIAATSFSPDSVQVKRCAPGSRTLVCTVKCVPSTKPRVSRSSLDASASSPRACHAVTGRVAEAYLSRSAAAAVRVRGFLYFARTAAIACLYFISFLSQLSNSPVSPSKQSEMQHSDLELQSHGHPVYRHTSSPYSLVMVLTHLNPFICSLSVSRTAPWASRHPSS